MSDLRPDSERRYQTDDAWSRAVHASRTGRAAAFLVPNLGGGMRLIDCGCGPGSITVDLALTVAPGEAIGIDLRADALTQARRLARERGIANVAFHAASVYHLPYAACSFDAAFACAVLQHLAAPLAALKEIIRVLKPGGVIGIADGSSTITFRYPTNPLLQAYDKLRGREREHNTGRPSDALALRALLREAGFARTQASGALVTETGAPAGSLEETRRVAQNHVIRLRGPLGRLAVAQGWATREELEQMAEALIAWGEARDALLRPARLHGHRLGMNPATKRHPRHRARVEGREARRPTSPAVNKIQAGRQSQDRQGAWADDPAIDPRPRR